MDDGQLIERVGVKTNTKAYKSISAIGYMPISFTFSSQREVVPFYGGGWIFYYTSHVTEGRLNQLFVETIIYGTLGLSFTVK